MYTVKNEHEQIIVTPQYPHQQVTRGEPNLRTLVKRLRKYKTLTGLILSVSAEVTDGKGCMGVHYEPKD